MPIFVQRKESFMGKIEILKELRKIELDNDIEILFACDIGK